MTQNPAVDLDLRKAGVTSREQMPPNESRWIQLNKIAYTDPIGRSRTWESAERKTRPSSSKADGVGVIAVLNYATGPELLLQKQFRPPLNGVTIELPSGLIDADETPEECALRELKEETGYIGTTTAAAESDGSNPSSTRHPTSFLMYNDPGFCNTNTHLVTVHVDVDNDPRNRVENLRPELEENEFIESFSIPLWPRTDARDGNGQGEAAKPTLGLYAELARLENEEGYVIDARVGTLALGLAMRREIG